MGLYTALKSLYTSKEARGNCDLHCTTEKTWWNKNRQLSAHLAVKESCWVFSPIRSNISRAAIKCNTCWWKQKGMISALLTVLKKLHIIRIRWLTTKLCIFFLYLWVCFSCSLIYLKRLFPNCHTSIQKMMHCIICFGAHTNFAFTYRACYSISMWCSVTLKWDRCQ